MKKRVFPRKQKIDEREAWRDFFARMDEENQNMYAVFVPACSGECRACKNFRRWRAPSGSSFCFCDYCAERNLPQPREVNFSEEKTCKAFQPMPPDWKLEDWTITSEEPPPAAMEPHYDFYPTGEEPLPGDKDDK